MNLCRLCYTALSTRFTASAMLAHESLLLSLHCSIPEIHSISQAGPWISAPLFCFPVHEIHSICLAGSKSLLPVFILPCLQDSQRLSYWLMNLRRPSLHGPVHEIHSIGHAGSWLSAASLILPFPQDSQHLSCWLMNLFCYPYTVQTPRFTASVMLAHESLPPLLYCSVHEIHSSVHEIHSIRHVAATLMYQDTPPPSAQYPVPITNPYAGTILCGGKSRQPVLPNFFEPILLNNNNIWQQRLNAPYSRSIKQLTIRPF
jgi:hypothetical protein